MDHLEHVCFIKQTRLFKWGYSGLEKIEGGRNRNEKGDKGKEEGAKACQSSLCGFGWV